MKSRILGQTNKSENCSLFSTQNYQNFQSDKEKQEYLLNYLQLFLSRFYQQSIQRQKIAPTIYQSFKDFSEILSQSFSLLLPDSFDDIIKILPIENTILEAVPDAPNYLQLIDLIFYQCFQQSDTNIQKDSKNAIFALFSSQSFCKAFISSGKYLDTIITLINYNNSQLTHQFYDFFLNEKFIQSLIEEDVNSHEEKGKYLNSSKLVNSYFTKILLLETAKDDIRYQLIEFGSKLIVQIFNEFEKSNQNELKKSNLFINELSELKLFEKSNIFFISHPSLSFMSMFYNNLLLNLNSDNNNKQFNSIILNYLLILYNDDRFSIEDGKVVIMHFFQTLNINYFSKNNNNFHILDWINESVFTSSLLFQVTSSFLTKCVYYNADYLNCFIDFFIQKVSPPFKKNYVYNEIFSWFLSLISLLIEDDNKRNSTFCFDANIFLQKLFYDPFVSDVSFYLDHFFNFRQLLLQISILNKENDKRNSNPRKITSSTINTNYFDGSIFNEKYFSRIIELIEFNRNVESLQEFFVSYLKNSFGKNLVLYFFHNISSSNHAKSLLFSFAQEFTNELIEIITSFNLLNEILKNEENFVSIVKVINLIVIKTNNHFFDDYIINEIPINSPIFQIDFKQIEKFILPAFYDDPIPIPSLIPFLFTNDEKNDKEKMIFKSPYNHYLLGYYAMPIYNKLKIPISRIICLEEILNQFIRFHDFCYIFENGPKDASILIQSGRNPEFPLNAYEIFPSEKPASILLNITSSYAAFKIRFETKHHFPSVLFNINGSPLLFIKDDYLIDISNTSIGKIQMSKWHEISFFYNKNTKFLSIGLDSEIVSTLSINNYKIDSIGSLQKPASIHYMIMNTISIGNSPEQSTFSEEMASKYFKPQGNILFVPNYSFHHLFESKLAFSRICGLIEKTVKGQYHDKICLFISLMSNWILNSDVSSEWYLNRYRYCLMQNISFCEPFYLTSILQTIIHLNDKIIRTKLFHSFICDFFFWTKFPERIVGQCLDIINNFIDDFPSVFDLKMLEETTIGNFLLSLTYFFRNSYILNGLIRFLKTLFTFFDEKYVAPILANFALISPYLNADEIEMVFDFEKGQNLGNTIISLAKEIRIARKIKIFKVEELLFLALLVNNQQLAINFTMKILQFCDSDAFVQQHLSILCRIVSRFPFNNLIWQKLFQLVTNDKNFVLSFGKNSNVSINNNGIRISILPLILSALIPLFNEESMFSESIKKIVFHLLKENQLILISKPIIKLFCSFLNGSIFGLVSSNLTIQPQQLSQNPKIMDFYSIFVDNINRTFVSLNRPNKSFYQYATMLLSSILISQTSNFKRFQLVLNVAVHSSNYFLIQMLITFFSTYIHLELTNQQLTLLNDVSLFALLNEKDCNARDCLSNGVFVYCIQSHERFSYFSKFFVFSYKYVSDDVKFRTLRSFKEYFAIQQPKTLNEIIPYLYIIICTDLRKVLNKTKTDELKEKKRNESPKSIVDNDRKRRLMNLKTKEKTSDSISSSLNGQMDSLAYEIFDYFIANFKQFPKDSKLSLLLKYKDYNELNIHQNDDDDSNLTQVKNYISLCMKNLQDEAYNNYKVVDLKGPAIPQDNLGIFLFTNFTEIAQRCKSFFNNLFADMNQFLRKVEKYYGSFININNTITSQNFSNDLLTEKFPNYHISPFYLPGFCPVVLLPSPFSALKDNERSDSSIFDQFCMNKIQTSLFGLEKSKSFASLGSNSDIFNKFDGYFDYQNMYHRMKISFVHRASVKTRKINVYFLHLNAETQNQQKILSFISIYGRPLQILNCEIIRRYIDLPSVLFKYKTRYLILPNCRFDGEEIHFTNQNNESTESSLNLTINDTFHQSIFLNEFGKYFLFMGHPVILVHLNDFIISHQCTDDTVTFSVGVFSSSNGSFVLSFSREDVASLQQKYQQQSFDQLQEESVVDPPTIYMLTSPDLLKQGILEKWLKGNISNIHYLTLLNLISGRSFDDLASYPIMPRVLSSFKGKSFNEVFQKNLRNLEFPISVISEALKSKPQNEGAQNDTENEGEFDLSSSFEVDLTDPCFNSLKKRYEIQKYHNCENISNGSIVSSFLIRIPPFVNYSLEFNDGSFDVPERMFTSIDLSCSINKFSTSELIPELFLLPEMMSNQTNRIKFPEGFEEEVVLPSWTSIKEDKKIQNFDFIMMHRRIIESMSIRKQISKWIDLVFGFKQSGEEAVNSLNVYNPLSYQSSIGSLPLLSKSSTSNISPYQMKTIRADFVKNSGQMPLKIFSSPHQPYSLKKLTNKEISASSSSSFVLKEKRSSPPKNRVQPIFEKNGLFGFNFDDITVRLKQDDSIDHFCLNRSKGDISINVANTVFKLFNSDFFNATNASLSKRGDFLAVTFCTSKVKIFRLFYFDVMHQNNGLLQQHPKEGESSFTFSEMAVLTRESIRFSVINDLQFICATVCKEEVILWSIVNGFIIHVIPIKNAKCVAFDDELNLIYIGADTKVFQFSINGRLLRTIETEIEYKKKSVNSIFNLPDLVQSIAVGGFGFSYDKRFVAVGKSGGDVIIFRQNNETLEFEIGSVFEVSNFPIVKLITKQNNFLVEAIDSYKTSTTVF